MLRVPRVDLCLRDVPPLRQHWYYLGDRVSPSVLNEQFPKENASLVPLRNEPERKRVPGVIPVLKQL